jgi:hypothetical protein
MNCDLISLASRLTTIKMFARDAYITPNAGRIMPSPSASLIKVVNLNKFRNGNGTERIVSEAWILFDSGIFVLFAVLFCVVRI